MSAVDPATLTDTVLPFHMEGGLVRGRLVRLGPALVQIGTAHGYPPAVSALMGQALALTAGLAALLKYDGVFTLQAQGDGPVSLLVADVTSNGDMRGYARCAADAVLSADSLLGSGHLAFTVDQGAHTERYQGIVALTGDDLAQGAETYFRQSEQLDSKVIVAGNEQGAAVLIVQKVPGNQTGAPIATAASARDAWETSMILAQSVRSGELLDPTLPLEKLANRLFHEQAVEVGSPRRLKAGCRCSEARIASTLRGIPRAEIDTLKTDAGVVSVTCEFCNTTYTFDDAALDAVYNPPVKGRPVG